MRTLCSSTNFSSLGNGIWALEQRVMDWNEFSLSTGTIECANYGKVGYWVFFFRFCMFKVVYNTLGSARYATALVSTIV
jgi:hypothetical protein